MAKLLAQLEDEMALEAAVGSTSTPVSSSTGAAHPPATSSLGGSLLTSWAEYGPGFVDDPPGGAPPSRTPSKGKGKKVKKAPNRAQRKGPALSDAEDNAKSRKEDKEVAKLTNRS